MFYTQKSTRMNNIRFTEHFSLIEFERSETAKKYKLDNTASPLAKDNLKDLCDNILEPARRRLEMPIIVTSGFRSAEVNRRVGGALNSMHLTGRAADIYCSDNERLLEILKQMPCYELIVYRYKQSGRINRFHVSYNGGRKGSWFSKYI